MKGKVLLTCLSVSFLMASGCCRELREVPGQDSSLRQLDISAAVQGGAMPALRGAVADNIKDDAGIMDMNVILFDSRGKLFSSCYVQGGSEASVGIFEADTYSLFIIANAGRVEAPEDIADMESYRYAIDDIQALSATGSLPMYGSAEVLPGSSGRISVPMKRMTAMISLCFIPDDGLEVELSSVRFADVPMDMAPFSEASVPVRTGHGDYDTGQDLPRLMSGNTVKFYMLEDMSSSNAVPPDYGIPASPDLPEGVPYIEIEGTVVNSAGLVTADVDYRLVLDWQIARNHEYMISFRATETGIYEDSYRIDVSDAVLDLPVSHISIPAGGTARLEVPASEYAVLSYVSSDSSIASVDAGGLISGHVPGTAYVNVSCPALSASAVCTVEVYRQDPFTDYELDRPEYAGEWGYIAFPTATADNPVQVTFGGTTLEVGRELPSGGMSSIASDGLQIFYTYDNAPQKIFLWNNIIPENASMHISQGRNSAVLVFDGAECPGYSLVSRTGINQVDLNDDGSGEYVEIYLEDSSGNILPLRGFREPDEISEYYDQSPYDEFYWDYWDSIEISAADGSDYSEYVDFNVEEYGWEAGESYIVIGSMHGLKTDGKGTKQLDLVFHNGDRQYDGVMQDLEVDVKISQTFQDQGYKGEIYNWQIAPYELRSDMAYLSFHSPVGAEWEVRRYYPDQTVGMSPEEIWENADSRFCSLVSGPLRDTQSGKYYVRFMEPERFDSDEFFACGSYIFKGTVVNEDYNHEVYGYYMVDIILYVSVVSQVDIEVSGPVTSRVYRSYVPLCEWSRDVYADFWSNMYRVPIYDIKTGTKVYLDGNVSESYAGSFTIPGAVNDPQASYNTVIGFLDDWFGRGTGDFYFFTPAGGTAEELVIDRDNYVAADAFGYYHFVRRYDESSDIENYLIEAYYRDFDRY